LVAFGGSWAAFVLELSPMKACLTAATASTKTFDFVNFREIKETTAYMCLSA
jgi:hypothetical protein